MICPYCKKEFETNLSLGCHKVRCSLNPNKKEWNSWRASSCWNKGLTKDTDERIKKQGETFHSRVENGEIKIQGHKHSIETKEILSKKRSEYLASAENAGGFKDVGWYKIKNIKNIEYVVRGLWEYNVALKLNELNILWIRNQYLNYFIDGVKKIYNPDFYLPDSNEYIEVKGYFSDKDKIKMDAVIDQNPNVKIRFMNYKFYSNFINGNILISEIPIYEFGKFNSGYKRKGVVEIKKEIKYCKQCGRIIVGRSESFCSITCYNLFRGTNKQIKRTNKRIKKDANYCLVCGKKIPSRQKYCSPNCANNANKKIKLTDEEKIDLLKTFSIQEIANKYNISYNAVRKWKLKLISV